MSTPLRVLIIEDSEDDALLILRQLQRGGYDVTYERVDTAEAMAAALDRQTWDIILSDYSMPRFSGLAALKLWQESGLDLPFIIVSGKIGEETAVEAMKAGAHDYVMKTNLKRLVPAVKRELAEAEERQKLKQAEVKYATIIETALDGFWITDLEGRFLEVNDAYCRMTGYTREELLIMSIPDVEAVEKHEETAQHMKEIVARGYDHFETKQRGKDGRLVDIEVSVKYYDVEGGQVIVFLRDITERKRAEEKLRESEEKFRNLASLLPQIVFETDERGNFIFLNRQFFEATGYAEEDFIKGLNALQMFAPQDRDRAAKNIQRRLSGEELGVTEYTVLRKDGTTFPVSIYSNRIISENRPAGLRGIVIDMTEYKMMEESRRVAEENFRHSLDSSPVGIRIVNAEGGLLYANQAILDIYGYSSVEELKNSPAKERYTPESYIEHRKRIENRKLRKLVLPNYEISIVRKDGEVRYLAVFRKEVVWGRKTQFQTLYQDITERKKAEESLKRSEQSYRELAESISDVFFALNKESRCTYWNRASERLTGISAKDALGKHIYDIFPNVEATRKQERKGVHLKALKTKQSQHFVGKYQFGGKDSFLEISFYPSQDGISVFAKDITDRIKAEKALRESEQNYRELAESISDFFFAVDKELRCTYWNKASEELTGISAKDALGKHIFDIVPAVAATREIEIKEIFLKAMRTKQSQQFVNESRLGGKDFFFEIIFYPSQDGGSIFIKDITERKRAEEKYRQLLEDINDGYAVIQEGKYAFANKRFSEIFGYKPGQAVGKSIGQLIVSDDRRATEERYEKVMRGEEASVERYEGKALREDGTTIIIEASIKVIQYEDKPAFSVIVRDVTEHRRAERELELRAQLLDAATDSIALHDFEGKLIYVNEAACKSHGYTKDELMAMNIRDLVIPEYASFAESWTRKAQKGEITVQTVHLRKDKSIMPIEVNFKVIEWGGVKFYLSVARDITERKQAEEALMKSEQNYRELAESISDVFFAMNKELRFTYWNKASEELTGISAKDALGKHAYAIFPDTKATRKVEAEEVYLKAIRTKQSQQFVNEHHLGGKDFVFEITAYPSQDGISVFIKDITERTKAEKSLRESEQKYRTLIENVPLEIFYKDKNLVYISCNDNYARDLKMASEEITGKTDDEFYPRELAEKYRTDDRRIIESGNSERIEERYVAGGKEMFVETFKTPVRDGKGEVIGVLGVFQDITERKKAEKALHEAEGKYRIMMDNAGDMILLADSKGNLLEANKKAEELLGYTKEELSHMTVAQIYPKQELERGLAAFREIAQKGSSTLNNGLILRKDGRTVAVDIIGNIIEYAGKKISQGIFRDITERRRMEEQLMITDRLASIGELASGMAHELNNPLTSVIGFSELLLEKDVPDDVKEDLRTINKEAQRTADVVRNLLTFARKHPKEKQLVDINNMIQKVLELRAYEQRINNIQVNTQFAPGLPEIMADGFQLQQVFMNIIINAEYFMIEAHGRGTFTITTERVGDIIQISLADDGPGIAEDNLGHIFDPFFTTKPVGKGTGLGLSICHGIVTAHSGRIYAESKSGKGATFVVELPISQQ